MSTPRPSGNANTTQSDITQITANSKLAKSTSDSLSIYSDYSVWDLTAGRYLQAGKDYNPGDMFRS